MSMKSSIKEIKSDYERLVGQEIFVQGWIKTNRFQKQFGFINLNDGSALANLQIVYDATLPNFEEVAKFGAGCSLTVKGTLVLTPQAKQPFEIKATEIILEGDSRALPAPTQRHTRSFCGNRSSGSADQSLQRCLQRRSLLAHAIHEFFRKKDFIYLHSPIITGSSGREICSMTVLIWKTAQKDGKVDYSKDFFGKHANLTVSGQLQAEAFAHAFKKVYTFGPTFRAEKSNTTRHASEFWMVEPEVAFADLRDIMDLIEEMIKFLIRQVFEGAKEELEFFDNFVSPGKIERRKLLDSKIHVCEYEDAVKIIQKADHDFEHKISFGDDLATEHEKYLTDVHFKGPVFVINWPKEIKAFYMRLNDDNKTVAAVDLLVPGSGELVGGSQREERLELLERRMAEMGVPAEEMQWYLDLRRFGGTVHSGFGLGFERMVMYVTGVENIRDVIPFPRTYRNCDY